MKDGVSARDVYQHAVTYVKNNMPDLEKNFVKSIGFGVISFTDIITQCTKTFLKDGH
jgi:nucleosome binding factor SPN SPT16 subunit